MMNCCYNIIRNLWYYYFFRAFLCLFCLKDSLLKTPKYLSVISLLLALYVTPLFAQDVELQPVMATVSLKPDEAIYVGQRVELVGDRHD